MASSPAAAGQRPSATQAGSPPPKGCSASAALGLDRTRVTATWSPSSAGALVTGSASGTK
eukprot:1488983-Lingulodinium_polyedra.AAC.1